jgi:hypothetical protein
MTELDEFAARSQSTDASGRRTITLPSGKAAALRKGKGRDLMRAQRAVAGSSYPDAVIFALIAELAEINDAPVVYEDVLEMDLDDVLVLQAEITGPNFHEPAQVSQAPAASQTLSTSDSASAN